MRKLLRLYKPNHQLQKQGGLKKLKVQSAYYVGLLKLWRWACRTHILDILEHILRDVKWLQKASSCVLLPHIYWIQVTAVKTLTITLHDTLHNMDNLLCLQHLHWQIQWKGLQSCSYNIKDPHVVSDTCMYIVTVE